MRGSGHFFRVVFAAPIALTALISPASAMEGGQSAYFKGYRDFLTGVVPSQGVQIRHDLYVYSGTERSTIPQSPTEIRLLREGKGAGPSPASCARSP